MAILAQYTIRSKQSYIFRTNAMREITGASALIRDAWHLLFEKTGETGLKAKVFDLSDDSFPYDSPGDAFKDGLRMIDLFRGGGNDTVLFRDVESMKLANAVFTRALLEECPGMIPMCAWVETSDDYREDYRKLMEASEREKNRMAPGQNVAMAPFSQMNRKTFQPIAYIRQEHDGITELTAEAKAKRDKSNSDSRTNKDNAELDNIGRLLAVVHADGNNMGAKIMGLLEKKTSYRDCVQLMRKFTQETARAFTGEKTNEPKGKLDEYAKQKGKKALERGEENDYVVRWIVNDGDDATFVCNAKRALELTKVYLRAVIDHEKAKASDSPKYSSCAGICLFHSHYPFSMAYAMAEEACDSAKKKVHRPTEKGRFIDEAWIDFHFIHSGLNDDLNDLREEQGTADCMARPWAVAGEKLPDDAMTTEKLEKLAVLLRLKHGVTRTNIKSLGAAWERRRVDGIAELHRVFAHAPKVGELKEELQDMFGDDENTWMKAIYDLAEVYDLWFRPTWEPVADVLKCLQAKDAEMLKCLEQPKEDADNSNADGTTNSDGETAQDEVIDKLKKLPEWGRIVSMFTRHGEKNVDGKEELRARKTLTDLVNITGWEDLLREGD